MSRRMVAFFGFLMHMTIDLCDNPRLHWNEQYAFPIADSLFAELQQTNDEKWEKIQNDMFAYFDKLDVSILHLLALHFTDALKIIERRPTKKVLQEKRKIVYISENELTDEEKEKQSIPKKTKVTNLTQNSNSIY